MRLKKVHLIDANNFYVEDQILQIPENLEEARLLNYPIVRETVQIANPSEAVEPQELTDAKERHKALKAIPGEDPVVVFAAQQLADTIADMQAQFERDRIANSFKVIETYSIPPLRPEQIEVEITGSFYKAKWTGKKWTEGLNKAEIQEMNRPKIPDWNLLQDSLRGTPVFAKAIATSATNGFALLLNTLSVTRNLEDLQFAIGLVRAGLSEDFTPEELVQINQILKESGFDLTIE